MGRKTVNVDILVDKANAMLSDSKMSPDFRKGVMVMVEAILSESNNYDGFRYLREHEVPDGEKAGIIFDPVNFNHEYPDETRRQYYLGGRMK